MLILNVSDVSEVFGMEQAFDAVREAALAHVRGDTVAPPRAALWMTRSQTEVLVMPAVTNNSVFGLKTWYALGQKASSLPPSSATIFLLIPDLELEVIMDAGIITDLRTGAMTGLAAQRLGGSAAETIALIGAGVQARTQATALVYACPAVKNVRVFSRNEYHRSRFVLDLEQELGVLYPTRQISVTADESAEIACDGADIVVAATTSSAPVIDDGWLEPNTLVCGVGSHALDTAEIQSATVGRAATVAVDTAAAIDTGDISSAILDGLLRQEDIVELGDLLGEDVPRTSSGVRVFKSVGFAAADVACAEMVVRHAVATGRGMTVDVHG